MLKSFCYIAFYSLLLREEQTHCLSELGKISHCGFFPALLFYFSSYVLYGDGYKRTAAAMHPEFLYASICSPLMGATLGLLSSRVFFFLVFSPTQFCAPVV